MQIGRYKLWFNRGWHCCGFQLFGIPVIGKIGRPSTIVFPDKSQFTWKVGGFWNYWIWRFTLTIFEKKTK